VSKIFITEFRDSVEESSGRELQVGNLSSGIEQFDDFTGNGSLTCAASTRFVRIYAEQKTHIKVGSAASADNMPVAANLPEYFGISPSSTIYFFVP